MSASLQRSQGKSDVGNGQTKGNCVAIEAELIWGRFPQFAQFTRRTNGSKSPFPAFLARLLPRKACEGAQGLYNISQLSREFKP